MDEYSNVNTRIGISLYYVGDCHDIIICINDNSISKINAITTMMVTYADGIEGVGQHGHAEDKSTQYSYRNKWGSLLEVVAVNLKLHTL